MIRVLVVDDSALIRDFLSKVLNEHPQIEVVATAPDPYKAVEILNREKVDVISLDLEMPRMDGLTFLEKLMKQRPIPVVICSSVAEENSENALRGLELGAVDIITKPKMGLANFLMEEKDRIQDVILAASQIKLDRVKNIIEKEKSFHKEVKERPTHLLTKTTHKVIAIGSSTGGTIALRYILERLPRNCHGIVITQHMPEGFTNSFSNSLNAISEMDVKESEENDKTLLGRAIVARGNHHLELVRSGAFYHCHLTQTPQVNRHRPSVDVMFNSIAGCIGKNAMGILLTGMGKDGAQGLMAIKEAGGITIAQNEESCVVYGMPKAAVDIGAAQHVLDLDGIIKKIIEFSNS